MKTPLPVNVDVVFVLDCTESMQPWIVAARNQIQSIMEYIRWKFNDIEIRMALVGYRDYGDEVPRCIVDFTNSAKEIRGALSKIEATGGFDKAEDLAGALYDVNHSLCWRSECNRMCFVITDAPTHGLPFHHDWISDRYPDEATTPSCISFEDQVSILAESKVSMTFVRITDDTDKMITKMGRIYDEFNTSFTVENLPIVDQSDLDDNFSNVVIRNVTRILEKENPSRR